MINHVFTLQPKWKITEYQLVTKALFKQAIFGRSLKLLLNIVKKRGEDLPFTSNYDFLKS